MTQDDAWRELFTLSLSITDVRSDHGKRHMLVEVIFMVVVALLAGAQNAEDVVGFARKNLHWFQQFLMLEHGVPAHDTVLRILALVKPTEMEGVVRAWTTALREPGALTVEGGHVAFDGQTLRGSADKALGLSGIDMVSAYLVGVGVVLGSERVDDKSNESIAIPNLVRSLNLRGATVTIDAIGCQHKSAAALREAEAHYILQVKDTRTPTDMSARCMWIVLAQQLRYRLEPRPNRPMQIGLLRSPAAVREAGRGSGHPQVIVRSQLSPRHLTHLTQKTCRAISLHLGPVGQGSPPMSEHLSLSHHRALLTVDDPRHKQYLARLAVAQGWSVAQLQETLRAENPPVGKPRGRPGLAPEVKWLAGMQRAVGPAVKAADFAKGFAALPTDEQARLRLDLVALRRQLQSLEVAIGPG